ncbi:hypothetical protein BJ085DRAFT_30947 [Dimargaris cristalligena]|uniref:Uncharacterized protein n=1 Tax=Dimargaris cristalligena TaxID=215637 RepID=A0A4Q0A0C2_9FUNG|nr:hypothetical protein BJ085DRAFT_30947 [Dimargaris cristalligena]|eukprot:RKP39526.1 hypothetical protein BJ085DRAFT_30947 [Dimargaris cristalligena]
MYVEVTPHGSFKQGYTELTTNITGYFGEKNVNFKAGKRMQSFDLKVPLMGYPRLFPFDNYDTLFEVYLKSGDKANEAPVPLHITIFGSVQTLDFHTAITRPNPDDHTVLFTIQTNRTAITVVFSIYIMTVMWCLAITISTLAFQIAVSRRQVPPGLLVSGVSMMFALPALRNAQPGIPSLGCASDALAFFWCIIIVAFCAVNNILLSVVRVEKKRKPAPEPEPAPESPRTKKRNSLIFPVVVADVEHAPAE